MENNHLEIIREGSNNVQNPQSVIGMNYTNDGSIGTQIGSAKKEQSFEQCFKRTINEMFPCLKDLIPWFRVPFSPDELERLIQSVAQKSQERVRQQHLSNHDNNHMKKITDQDWIDSHGTNQLDASKAQFSDLPLKWQKDSLESAQIAIELVEKQIQEGGLLSGNPPKEYNLGDNPLDEDSFIEAASADLHKRWFDKNQTGEELYLKLSDSQKEKDRLFIRAARDLVIADLAERRDIKDLKEFQKNYCVNLTSLKEVHTDLGINCDDQMAIAHLIREQKAGEEIVFVVNGPNPREAAMAIAQLYSEKNGHYPLIALGQEFGPKSTEVYSFLDGQLIDKQKHIKDPEAFQRKLVSFKDFHQIMDSIVRAELLKSQEKIILSRLCSNEEFHSPFRGELAENNHFQESYQKIAEKKATMQFGRNKDGEPGQNGEVCWGGNFGNSDKEARKNYLDLLQKKEFDQVYVDASVARQADFLVKITDLGPGVKEAARDYLAKWQVYWSYMTYDAGKTPSQEQMRAGIFTDGAYWAFGVHVSGQDGEFGDFGQKKIMREIYGIDKANEDYQAAKDQLAAEHDRFDQQVLAQLHETYPGKYSHLRSVDEMRAQLHQEMISALQEFGQEKGIDGSQHVSDFSTLFQLAEEQGKSLNYKGYMDSYKDSKGFKEFLLKEGSFAKAVTDIAEVEKNRKIDGKSHVERMAEIFTKAGARAVMHDAVAIVASKAVSENKALKEYFTENDGALNVSAEKVASLKEENPPLYQVLLGAWQQAIIH